MKPQMSPLEALADAIHQYEGWFRDSRAWRNRNPGNLRPYDGAQMRDNDGYRVFATMEAGWGALLDDLLAKFGGSHGLTKESTLLDLFNCYAPAGDANNPAAYSKFVCAWCSHILGKNITPTMKLGDYYGGTP